MTINHHALPPPNLSETKLLAKMPISIHATQPPCPPSLNFVEPYLLACLSAIIPIQPSNLCPDYATFKPLSQIFKRPRPGACGSKVKGPSPISSSNVTTHPPPITKPYQRRSVGGRDRKR